MENNEKFDFIRKKLNENTEEMPKALSAENITSELENIGVKEKRESLNLKRLMPLVASIAIVALSVLTVMRVALPALNTNGVTDENINENILEKSETVTETENEYRDIIEYFKNRLTQPELFSSFAVDDKNYSTGAPTTAVEESFYEAPALNYSNSTEESIKETPAYGETNTQVKGIDEGDIIENDGEYIYVLRSSRRTDIYRASDLKLMSETLLPQEKTRQRYSYNNEMYLSGDRLVIISTSNKIYDDGQSESPQLYDDVYVYNSYCAFRVNEDATADIFVYDVSDKEEPRLVFESSQSGDYNTSRLVGNILYTVSQYSVYGISADESDEVYKEKCIPEVNGKKILRSNIDLDVDACSDSYIVVTSCDISKSEADTSSYAYLGYANDVYCSGEMLYMSAPEYIYGDAAKKHNLKEGDYTHVYAVSLSANEIKFKNECLLKGTFINQFSMDEYNGCFRCAMTYTDKDWQSVNCVLILDKDFKEIGRLDGLADKEEIKAVRFMGDTAYVITFRNTDPLFILDLSNPENPKKDGEVKLNGFSAYLHPINDDYIVGVGYGGTSTGIDDSVQVTLFCVKDKKNPTVASQYKIKEVSTEVNYNFKAFLYMPEKNVIGIPVEKYVNSQIVSSYILFKVNGAELELMGEYKHDISDDSAMYDIEITQENDAQNEYFGTFFRGTYIGERLYTVSENKICAFDIGSAEKLFESKLGE